MTNEDKQEFRALMLEVSSAVADSMRKQVVEELRLEFKPISRQIVELQADVAVGLDRSDRVEPAVEQLRTTVEQLGKVMGERLDGLETVMVDVKAHLAKISREQMRDRSARDEMGKRLDRLEAERES